MNLSGTLWEYPIWVWINFFERSNANWSNVEHFCEKFNILKFDESLHEEFLDYKSFREEELPAKRHSYQKN